MRLKLLFLFLISAHFQPGFSQVTGMVFNAQNKMPVGGVTIFINRSMRFAVTDSGGNFNLPDSMLSPYEIVTSKSGYQTHVYSVNKGSDKQNLKFEIKPLTISLITVDSSRLMDYQQFFLRQFYGSTYNTEETFVTNPEVLNYKYDENSGILSVSSNGLINIINDGLGYLVHYQLDSFSLNIAQNITYFKGYCFFSQLSTKKLFIADKWRMRRKLAYNGSMLHFVRSLYREQQKQEGFIIKRTVRILENEPGYKAALRSKNMVRTGFLQQRDLKAPFVEILDLKSDIQAQEIVADSAGQHSLYSSLPLFVEWIDKSPKNFLGGEMLPEYRSLIFFKKQPVSIFENGLYFKNDDMVLQGYMQEKISDLLPAEYLDL